MYSVFPCCVPLVDPFFPQGYSLKFDPDKRESHRGVKILQKHGYQDIPYLQRHGTVGVAFPEMTRYGRFKQLGDEKVARDKEREMANK